MNKLQHLGSTELVNPIYLGIAPSASYPVDDYGPDEAFPEYPFSKDSLSPNNQVYRLLRDGFRLLGYDLQNYGTKSWNPLGNFINQGNTVLLKPNWVMHYNKNKKNKDNLECLVTHPSIIRAVIDYTIIALKNSGKIIVADAPMQGCDLNQLFFKAGYRELFKFYEDKGLNIEFIDLRENQVVTKKGVITKTFQINSIDQSVKIDLGRISNHMAGDEKTRYKVSDYTADRTNSYHNHNNHLYSINKTVLESDVIINLPKPKCHRLAGITAAQKNFVGIVFDKASLPHRKIGSKSEGGDEYKNKSIIKKLISTFEEKKLMLTENGKTPAAYLTQAMIVMLYYASKLLSKDKYLIGSWYGNDTIWRTVADLNYIVHYTDKEGNLCNLRQRKILNIADMIIAGQGDGPIGPTLKHLGILLIGEDSIYMDALCAKIMGFDIHKIPGLPETINNQKYNLEGYKIIYSNNNKQHNINFEDFRPEEDWRFEPHQIWKGFIEQY